MRRVKLTICGHFITTTGDQVQPIKIGATRWCGQCHQWRKIESLLTWAGSAMPTGDNDE